MLMLYMRQSQRVVALLSARPAAGYDEDQPQDGLTMPYLRQVGLRFGEGLDQSKKRYLG